MSLLILLLLCVIEGKLNWPEKTLCCWRTWSWSWTQTICLPRSETRRTAERRGGWSELKGYSSLIQNRSVTRDERKVHSNRCKHYVKLKFLQQISSCYLWLSGVWRSEGTEGRPLECAGVEGQNTQNQVPGGDVDRRAVELDLLSQVVYCLQSSEGRRV